MLGTFLATLVRLRPEIDREAMLAAFCRDPRYGSGRYDLDYPFGHGSLTYATDARSIVRAEIANRREDGERTLPDVRTCWDKYWHPAGEFIPYHLPPIDTLTLGRNGDYGVCPLCSGRRVSVGEHYPTYEWTESREAFLRDYDIDDNTTLDKSCELCSGKLYDGPWQVRVAGVLMDYSRLKPIAALPNVRVSATTGEKAILFLADGFEGMAMGMNDA